MYTKINKETCIACGNCYSICPEVYDCDEDGIAYSKLGEYDKVPRELEKNVVDCFECCPTESVKIIKGE